MHIGYAESVQNPPALGPDAYLPLKGHLCHTHLFTPALAGSSPSASGGLLLLLLWAFAHDTSFPVQVPTFNKIIAIMTKNFF